MEPSNLLIVGCASSTWGARRTEWRFELAGGRIGRLGTGQA
jgi:hypothetical protein